MPEAKILPRPGKDWLLISYSIMLLSWAFDFKAGEAGSGAAIQGVYLAMFAAAFFTFLNFDRGGKVHIAGLNSFLIACGVLMVDSILAGMAHGQDGYSLFRQSISVAIYPIMTFATARLFSQSNLASVRKILAVFCLIYCLSQLFILFAFQGGTNLSTARYEILGTSTVAATAYVDVWLLFSLSTLESATMGVNFVLIFLSVTRTYLVGTVILAAPAWQAVRRMMSPRMVVIGFVAFLGLVAFGTLSADGFARWVDRGDREQTSTGEAYTVYTRRVETEYMYGAWTSGPDTLLLGNGLAAQTVYYNPREVGGGEEHDIGFGHNQHMSILFVAGLLGGGPLLFLQFLQLFQAMRYLNTLARRNLQEKDVFALGAWGSGIIIGLIVAGFLTPTFSFRGIVVWYGIGTGLLLGARSQFDPRNARLNTAREAQARPLSPPPAVPAFAHLPPAVRRRREWLAQQERAG